MTMHRHSQRSSPVAGATVRTEEHGRRLPLAIWVLAACFFTFGTGEFVVAGLLLDISRDLAISASLAGRLVSAYAVGVVVGALIAPEIARQLPPKTALAGLMALLVAGDLLCALAGSYPMLLGARFVAGLSQAAFFGIASSIAADMAGPDRKGAAIAAVFTGVTLANLLGVPSGVALGHAAGWRVTFWAIAALGAIASVALLRLMPPTERSEPRSLRAELSGLCDVTLGLAFLSTMLVEGAVLMVFTYISPILVEVAGFGQQALGPILVLFGLGFVIGNWGGGKLADHRLLPALMGLIAFLAVVLLLLTVTSHDRVLAAATVFLFGVAAFAVVPGLQLRVVDKAGAALTLAPTLNIAAFNVGNAGGALLGGIVIDGPLGLTAVPWVGALVALAGLSVTALAWVRDRTMRIKESIPS